MQHAKSIAAALSVASLAGLLLYQLKPDAAEQPPSEQPSSDGVSAYERGPRVSVGPSAVERTTPPTATKPGHSPIAPSASAALPGHAVVAQGGGEGQGIRIAELDALLELNAGEFREREQDMHTELANILKDDPVAQAIEVRCADGFCRLRLDKPVGQGMAWDEIDQAIAPVTRGEMIFGAEPNGETRTTAYVYFSRDSQLPIAVAARAPEEE